MTVRRSVDLPAPLAPMMARVSPGDTLRLISVSACRYLCRTLRLRTSSIDVDPQVHLLHLRVGKHLPRLAFRDQASSGEADDAAHGAGQRVHDMLHPDDRNRSLPHLLDDLDQLRHLGVGQAAGDRSEEHTSELQSRSDLVCRLLLEKKNKP